MKTILFDIDGTLSDAEHRRNFLQGEKPDWHSFNKDMGNDLPRSDVVDLYQALWQSGRYEIILITGRSEEFRGLTEQWFAWNEIPFDRMIMRKTEDCRRDEIVKEELLDQLLEEGKDIGFVVDDRQSVVDMWRRRGITCLQSDVGDF